jgi:hypothetical protein
MYFYFNVLLEQLKFLGKFGVQGLQFLLISKKLDVKLFYPSRLFLNGLLEFREFQFCLVLGLGRIYGNLFDLCPSLYLKLLNFVF